MPEVDEVKDMERLFTATVDDAPPLEVDETDIDEVVDPWGVGCGEVWWGVYMVWCGVVW